MSQPPLNPKWDTGEGMTPDQYQEAHAWRAQATPEALLWHDQAMALLSDYFNDGHIPDHLDDQGGYLLGVSTIFCGWVRQAARAAYQAGWNDARQAAVGVCLGQADQMDGRLPDAHGGTFAKKFAANNLRGAAGLIRKLVPGAQG